MALVIKLVRHAESEANTGRMHAHETGDHAIPLSPRGVEQARDVGLRIGREFLEGALVYTSPYLRTRETLTEVFRGCGLEPPSGPRHAAAACMRKSCGCWRSMIGRSPWLSPV